MASFTDWDVVVIGAGPAGCALAITLVQRGWRVLIIEKNTSATFSFGELLPPASIGLVEHYLGPISDSECDERLGLRKVHGNISCWQSHSCSHSDTSFTAKGYGLSVQRQVFDEVFRRQAIEAGAVLHCGETLLACQRDEGGMWSLTTQSQPEFQHYRSLFVVDASGRSAVLAELLGVERYHYDQLCAFALRFISSTACDDGYTRAEACADGWWSSHCNSSVQDSGLAERFVVFFTDRDLSVAKPAANTKQWLGLINQNKHFGSHLSAQGYAHIGRINMSAAGNERLAQCCGFGWLAIGDAAQACDPIASYGLFKALESAKCAAQLLHSSLETMYCKEAHCTELYRADKQSSSACGGLTQRSAHSTHIHSRKGYSASPLLSRKSQRAGHFYSASRSLVNRYNVEQNTHWAAYTRQYEHYYESQIHLAQQPFWSRRIKHGCPNIQQKVPINIGA